MKSSFLSQPHRPFFILGVANAVIMMAFFAFAYKGLFRVELDPLYIHVYTIVFTVFTNFFLGFIFTTYPRFAAVEPISQGIYSPIFYSMFLGSVIFLLGAYISVWISLVAMFIIAYANYKSVLLLQNIYKSSPLDDLEDAFWILRSFQISIVANILMIISLFIQPLQNIAIAVSFFMFCIFLTFAVGQRMIPFFSHSMSQKNPYFVKTIFMLFIFKTLFFAFDINNYLKSMEILVDIILCMLLMKEFLRWNLFEIKAPPILWILHLGLFWLPVAFFIDALALVAEMFLETSFSFLGLHLIALGFLTTILIGFGTRVTYGHSGQVPQASGLILYLFYFTQLVVLSRFLYSLNLGFSWSFEFLFDISITAWLILFILWAYKFIPTLIKGYVD